MTIKHLNTLRLISLGLICVAAAAAVLMAHKPQWVLLLACILVLLVWMRLLLSRMLRLVERLGYEQMDPERLELELGDLSKMLRRLSTRKNRNLMCRLKGLLHELRGEFSPAIDALLQIDLARGGVGSGSKWAAIRLYLRAGKLPMARALIHQMMGPGGAYGGLSGPAQLHAMGLMHLEQGEPRQAEERLRAALAVAQQGFYGLNALYDLARLYELQGRTEQAGDFYRRAAAQGAKTWLGREAARRCSDLDVDSEKPGAAENQ